MTNIKKGNLLAHKIKDDIAKDKGFDDYRSADRHIRAKIRDESTEEIRKVKLVENMNKNRVNSSPKLDIDIGQIL